jgi:hypothetical protein
MREQESALDRAPLWDGDLIHSPRRLAATDVRRALILMLANRRRADRLLGSPCRARVLLLVL